MLLTPELPSKPGDHLEVASAADPGALYESTFRPIEALPFRFSEPVGGHSLLFNATVELLPPEITAISPRSGSSGTDVTITGRHLAVATAVTIGGIPAVGLFWGADDNQITAIVPRQAAGGTATVQVTTAGGTSDVTPASLITYSDPSTGPDTTPPLAQRAAGQAAEIPGDQDRRAGDPQTRRCPRRIPAVRGLDNQLRRSTSDTGTTQRQAVRPGLAPEPQRPRAAPCSVRPWAVSG